MSDDSPPSPPPVGGGPDDSSAPDDAPAQDNSPEPNDPPAPDDGDDDVPPPPGGDENLPPLPNSGGSSRQLNIRRVGAVVLVLGVVIGAVALVVFGGLPSIPGFGGCNANPDVGIAHYQVDGANGDRVDVQLTSISGADNVTVTAEGSSDTVTLTEVGDTASVNASSVNELAVTATADCGEETMDEWRAE